MQFPVIQLPASAKAFAHWAEHPNTIRWVQNRFALPVGVAGMTAIGVADVWKAQPEERKKVIIQDALVLGATAAGTLAAARGIGVGRFKGLMNYDHGEGVKELAEKLGKTAEQAAEGIISTEKKLLDWGYNQNEVQKFVKAFKKEDARGWADITQQRQALRSLFDHMKKTKPDEWRNHADKMFTEGPEEGFLEEAKKAASFFAVGGVSVLSGLAGGLAANKINNVKDPDATVNMIKEGIFQFVANIALCAVGAGIALGIVNGEWGPKKDWNLIRKAGDKFKDAINNSGSKTLIRTGIIGAGLSVGIFGGSHLANVLARKYVNPFFDKMQGKTPQDQPPPYESPPPYEAVSNDSPPPYQEKRKIEFWDWILHLDDLPTAMALAGVKIIEPIIWLFFAFSGYRTGKGYRNDEASQNKDDKPEQANQPAGFPAQQRSALPFGNQPFGGFSATPQPDLPQTFGKQTQKNSFQWAYPQYNTQYR